MGTQAGFSPNAFGPFGAFMQSYVSTLEKFSRSATDFDPQAMAAQATGPLKAAARCQLEVMGLLNRRAQAYLQIPTRLAQCRTPHDVVNEQIAFWQTAMEHYSECSRKVAESWTTLVPADALKVERDYISFSNGSGREHGGTPRTQDGGSGKQRRVA